MVVLQAELERVKVENLRLRDMLNQVNNNYSALQMHVMSLMHDQSRRRFRRRWTSRTTTVEERWWSPGSSWISV
ncbi:unnamed protein product [Linum trigynum]|uniref:Uncharacterized protein n=1 Tax=Linum trigynum TaxID=586398 RepID=A0AAV2GPN9_9ROSI